MPLVLMIVGFLWWWPLGLLILGYLMVEAVGAEVVEGGDQ